jgi:hypothetical protein
VGVQCTLNGRTLFILKSTAVGIDGSGPPQITGQSGNNRVMNLIMIIVNESEWLPAAQEYAAKGWAVIPLAPNDKTPLTKHGFKDATTDSEEIHAWAEDHPNANLGIRTGIASGLVVFDLDVKNGKDGIKALLDAVGALPKTLTATTPSGGLHHYYKHPGAHTPIRLRPNSVGWRVSDVEAWLESRSVVEPEARNGGCSS